VKKNKVYFGKKHLTHKEGRHNGKFVVPRMFHRYFTLRHMLARWSAILKMACNSSSGARGHNMHVSSEDFRKMVLYRRRIGMTLHYHLGVSRMQVLLDDITACRDKQAKQDAFVREVATQCRVHPK